MVVLVNIVTSEIKHKKVMEPSIAVVIPTCNRGSLIEGTLRSIQSSTIQDFEVFVVDQSDDKVTANVVEQFSINDGRFSLLYSPIKGADIARNMGIKASSAPIIALIDDDCRVTENWLEALLAEYNTHPNVDSIFGKIVPGEVPNSYRTKEKYSEIKRLLQILPMAKKDGLEREYFKDDRLNLGFGHGANMSFRRSTFQKFGLFDEYLGAGKPLRSWEERDMGYRILANGGMILFSPKVIIYHDHWREWKSVRRAYRNYAIGTGAAVGKYIRMGDWASIKLLTNWFIQQGLRQIFSGIIHWRSWQKSYVGLLQLIYPWVGLFLSMQYTVDKERGVYTANKKSETSSKYQMKAL
jgi:glycosyltransferase involved in cell wall biosynthesis